MSDVGELIIDIMGAILAIPIYVIGIILYGGSIGVAAYTACRVFQFLMSF